MTLRGVLGRVTLLVVSTVVALVLLEGVSSLVLIWRDTGPPPALHFDLSEGRHTRYDSLLGWVNVPNVAVESLYGPGIGLHTDGRGFRITRPAGTAAAGSVRVVCTGDSFTLGVGVRDEQAWCAIMGQLDPRFETVNMGQGAYGIDQAYLWFMRDGRALNPQVHLFGFIADDFRRMTRSDWSGYAKPRLALRHDSLVLVGVPVERTSGRSERSRRFKSALATSRAWILGGRIARKLGVGAARTVVPDEQSMDVARRVFTELRGAAAQRITTLVLIQFPTTREFEPTPADSVRNRVRRMADELRIPFIDFVGRLRALPRAEAERLFIARDYPGYAFASGHFSPEGNRWVAEQIVAFLHGEGIGPAAGGSRTRAVQDTLTAGRR